MSNLEMSHYAYFKYWLKHLTDEDVGALMIFVPFALAMLGVLMLLATYYFLLTVGLVLTALWIGTAVYLLTKN